MVLHNGATVSAPTEPMEAKAHRKTNEEEGSIERYTDSDCMFRNGQECRTSLARLQRGRYTLGLGVDRARLTARRRCHPADPLCTHARDSTSRSPAPAAPTACKSLSLAYHAQSLSSDRRQDLLAHALAFDCRICRRLFRRADCNPCRPSVRCLEDAPAA